MITAEETNFIYNYFQQHLTDEIRNSVDVYVEEMDQYPEKADAISKVAIKYIKENIPDNFIKTVGLLHIWAERRNANLPILGDVFIECDDNIKRIKNKIMRDLLTLGFDKLLFI